MYSQTKKILLADDDKDDCLMFSEALEELPIVTQLTTVHDGDQLMRLLMHDVTELPYVLFLDLNMPRKNGLSCLEEIKCHDRLKSLSVIIFSTPCEQEIADQLFDFGAYLYICKPTDYGQLKSVIHQALTRIALPNVSVRAKDNFMLKHVQF